MSRSPFGNVPFLTRKDEQQAPGQTSQQLGVPGNRSVPSVGGPYPGWGGRRGGGGGEGGTARPIASSGISETIGRLGDRRAAAREHEKQMTHEKEMQKQRAQDDKDLEQYRDELRSAADKERRARNLDEEKRLAHQQAVGESLNQLRQRPEAEMGSYVSFVRNNERDIQAKESEKMMWLGIKQKMGYVRNHPEYADATFRNLMEGQAKQLQDYGEFQMRMAQPGAWSNVDPGQVAAQLEAQRAAGRSDVYSLDSYKNALVEAGVLDGGDRDVLTKEVNGWFTDQMPRQEPSGPQPQAGAVQEGAAGAPVSLEQARDQGQPQPPQLPPMPTLPSGPSRAAYRWLTSGATNNVFDQMAANAPDDFSRNRIMELRKQVQGTTDNYEQGTGLARVVAGRYGEDLESGRGQQWAEILGRGSPDEAIRYIDEQIVRLDRDAQAKRDVGEQFKPDTLEQIFSRYGDETRPLFQRAHDLAIEDWQAAGKFRDDTIIPRYTAMRAEMHQKGPDYVTVPQQGAGPAAQPTAQQLREQQMKQQQRTAAPPPPPPSVEPEPPSVQPSAVDEEERRQQRARSQPG